jgi:hypothetical protein
MIVVAKGASLGPSSPAFVFYHAVHGILRDLAALSFQVFDVSTEAKKLAPLQVIPATLGERQAVAVDGAEHLGTGRYAPLVDIPEDEAAGAHEIRWFWQYTGESAEREARQDFDVADAVPPLPGALYCLPSDLRAEGLPSSTSDVRAMLAIGLASAYIERVTGRYFEPRYTPELFLDGRNASSLLLNEPVIALESLAFDSAVLTFSEISVESGGYKVYNRHLSGLVQPDDRQNPRIDLYGIETSAGRGSILAGRFPRGSQNVQVAGVFGYTEADGTPFGRTPALLRYCAQMLALRNIPRLTSSARTEARDRPYVASESTREQSVSYNRPASASAGITGDSEIDTLLLQFRRPFALGAALWLTAGG